MLWPAFVTHDIEECDVTKQCKTDECSYLKPLPGKRAIFYTDLHWISPSGQQCSIARTDLIQCYIYLLNLSATTWRFMGELSRMDHSLHTEETRDWEIKMTKEAKLVNFQCNHLWNFMRTLVAFELAGTCPLPWGISTVDLRRPDLERGYPPLKVHTFALRLALSYLPVIYDGLPSWTEQIIKLVPKLAEEIPETWIYAVPATAWAMNPVITSKAHPPRKWMSRVLQKLSVHATRGPVTGSRYGSIDSDSSLPFFNQTVQSPSSERVPLIR